MHYFKHDTAIIENNVQIGEGTKIWCFSHILSGVNIGANCNIGQNVFIGQNVEIGNNVKVQNNVSLYTGVTCEADVFIGPSVVFTNVINPRSFIERKEEFKSTLVQRGATIGANATILCGITIGNYSMIGAGAVILKDVPTHAIMVGNPAKQIGWISRDGFILNFENNAIAFCKEEQQSYQLLAGTITILK